jgi:hypothetical protein
MYAYHRFRIAIFLDVGNVECNIVASGYKVLVGCVILWLHVATIGECQILSRQLKCLQVK